MRLRSHINHGQFWLSESILVIGGETVLVAPAHSDNPISGTTPASNDQGRRFAVATRFPDAPHPSTPIIDLRFRGPVVEPGPRTW